MNELLFLAVEPERRGWYCCGRIKAELTSPENPPQAQFCLWISCWQNAGGKQVGPIVTLFCWEIICLTLCHHMAPGIVTPATTEVFSVKAFTQTYRAHFGWGRDWLILASSKFESVHVFALKHMRHLHKVYLYVCTSETGRGRKKKVRVTLFKCQRIRRG